jgi:uncharacterized UBP type Zn finger protein
MASTPSSAAAAASRQGDSDATVARKWAALEQLTQVFGFDRSAAEQAIEVVGADVEAACSFILDSGLGTDKGGPVVPIDNCPHLERHAKMTLSDLDDSFDPSSTRCSYVAETTKIEGVVGKAKVEFDNDTGTCSSSENWFCLECGVLRCSRYVNGHGIMHWKDTKTTNKMETPPVGHCVAISLADLSVWCYECGAYVTHPSMRPLLEKMENLKFRNFEAKSSAAHCT